MNALVSTEWLAGELSAPDIRVVDATWFLPGIPRDPAAEYVERHIPGAVRFDIDEIADTEAGLPHMLPSPAKFSSRVRKLGLGDGLRIVVYDANRFFASARVWWTFRVMGHPEVAVLDGGLEKWLAEGRPVDDATVRPQERHFTPRFDNTLVRELDQLRSNLTSRKEQVLDARPAGRFTGKDPEPRPGLRSGHIPQSCNLPFTDVVAADGTLLPPPALERQFKKAGIALDRPIVTTCGSGVSASLIALALWQLGRKDVAVYDGSWAEWGGRSDTPVVT